MSSTLISSSISNTGEFNQMSNCLKCKYMQRITKNKASRCFKHGIAVLLQRLSKAELLKERAIIREMRRIK
jgi:hypothetical protein